MNRIEPSTSRKGTLALRCTYQATPPCARLLLINASRYMLARIGTISRNLSGALNRWITQARHAESTIQKKTENGKNTATNLSAGASARATPTLAIGIRQKMRAKIRTVPKYGIVFCHSGIARAGGVSFGDDSRSGASPELIGEPPARDNSRGRRRPE